MNKYQLIVFDLDGTLLNDRMKITNYSKMRLNKLIKNGFKCAVISGRNLSDIKKIIKNIPFSYIGALNGALIYNNKTFKTEKEIFLSNKIANDMLINKDIKNYIKDFYTNEDVVITGFAKNKFARLYQQRLKPGTLKKNLADKKIYEIDIICENDSEALVINKYLNKKYKIFYLSITAVITLSY